MKPGKRLLISLYAAVIIYLLGNLFIGECGVMEKRKLADYRNMLSVNIGRLMRTGSTLEEHSLSLRSDPDMVALLARELGYLRDDEVLVSIEGFKGVPDRYTVGRTLTRSEYHGSREPVTRTLAGVAGILVFLGLSFVRKQQHD